MKKVYCQVPYRYSKRSKVVFRKISFFPKVGIFKKFFFLLYSEFNTEHDGISGLSQSQHFHIENLKK